MGADVGASHSHSISGLNFVASEFKRIGTPSVASLSLGGGASDAIDKAVVNVKPPALIKPFVHPNFLLLF